MNRSSKRYLCLFIAALVAVTTGCRLQKDKRGSEEDVDIHVPFGGISVKTDSSATSISGFTPYPNAQHDAEDDNKKNASVDMSFGHFHLHIKAITFHSSDPQDKIVAFYKHDMKTRYGDVLECRNDQPVGDQIQTRQGLRCDTKGKDGQEKASPSSHKDNHKDSFELRAGSPRHQRIVGLDEAATGTKFVLLDLELPDGDTAD